MVKIGVFGVGHLGKFHLSNWEEIDGVTIQGFYDPSKDNALAAVKQYKVKRYRSTDELISECDAVDIVAPTPAHFEISKKAILKSKHVFVEKPLANTMNEAKEL